MMEDSAPEPSVDPAIYGNRSHGTSGGGRTNWVEAIFGLVESRAAIISLEAKDALGVAIAKIVPLAVCLFCVFAVWALVVAATIGCLASATGWAWYLITFAMAGLHLFLALVAAMIAKRRKAAHFPVTRAEFEKDREWLIQLKNRND